MPDTDRLQVVLGTDGYYPQTLRWQGRAVRVLAVEGVQTRGPERRFRARTREGCFQVAFRPDSGVWYVLRVPGWFERLRARLEHAPRYPLPSWRRRQRARPAPSSPPLTGRPAIRYSVGTSH